MRVLLVQFMAGFAGSENYFLKFLPALVRSGVDVSFLVIEEHDGVHKNDEFVATLFSSGIPVDRLVIKNRMTLAVVPKIAAYVRQRRFSVVQSNLIYADLWLSLVKRFYLKSMPLVSVKHGYSDTYQARYGFEPTFLMPSALSLATRIAASNANVVVTISAALRKFFRDSGLIATEKMTVIPYGFDRVEHVHELTAGEARYGEPQLVSVGRLVPVKQNHLLLEAYSKLHAAFPDSKLVIVGTGPEETSLRALARARGVEDSIVWCGFRRNVPDYIRDSDLLVFPSRAEGFGAVIIEAWHHRKAVVAFDAPAQNEIITHGYNGILVPPYDIEILKEWILTLLRDPVRLRALGENGYQTAREQYGVARLVGRMRAIYEGLATPGSQTF